MQNYSKYLLKPVNMENILSVMGEACCWFRTWISLYQGRSRKTLSQSSQSAANLVCKKIDANHNLTTL